MIAFVKGELVHVSETSIIVENNGMGFEILVPATVAMNMPGVGKEVMIYTYTYVREDLLQLYGFLTRDELAMFKLLITVNGIGPKGALGILSAMDVDTLRYAILADDAKSISKAPGIGAKTASKLVIELKDKCKIEDIVPGTSLGGNTSQISGTASPILTDAVEALVALGYSSTDAMRAVKQVDITEDMTVETLLKLSLKNI